MKTYFTIYDDCKFKFERKKYNILINLLTILLSYAFTITYLSL